jgi:hypothetical protein
VRARPSVLRRPTEAVGFIGDDTEPTCHAWRDVLQSFEAARTGVRWSGPPRAPAEALLIDGRTAHATAPGMIGFAPPRSQILRCLSALIYGLSPMAPY